MCLCMYTIHMCLCMYCIQSACVWPYPVLHCACTMYKYIVVALYGSIRHFLFHAEHGINAEGGGGGGGGGLQSTLV